MKELMGASALILTFVAFAPYIRGILLRTIKPHVFSWFIWALGTFVVFIAQLRDGGGYGAWVIGVSGMITMGVAITAWGRSADRSIVKLDWVFLGMALLALPLWFGTREALSAVIILTMVDLLGFGPAVRKAIKNPFDESMTFFLLGAVRNLFVILALGHYSWTTVLFPAAVGIACVSFVALITVRRQQLAPNSNGPR